MKFHTIFKTLLQAKIFASSTASPPASPTPEDDPVAVQPSGRGPKVIPLERQPPPEHPQRHQFQQQLNRDTKPPSREDSSETRDMAKLGISDRLRSVSEEKSSEGNAG